MRIAYCAGSEYRASCDQSQSAGQDSIRMALRRSIIPAAHNTPALPPVGCTQWKIVLKLQQSIIFPSLCFDHTERFSGFYSDRDWVRLSSSGTKQAKFIKLFMETISANFVRLLSYIIARGNHTNNVSRHWLNHWVATSGYLQSSVLACGLARLC